MRAPVLLVLLALLGGGVAAAPDDGSVAARHMGWADKVGSIAPGRYGDLIAVKGNPLEDVRRLEQVAVVVKGGTVFKQP